MPVCLSSVTLVHPAKSTGRNEMPFGWDTHVVPTNVVVDRGPGSPYRKGRFRVGTPSQNLHG